MNDQEILNIAVFRLRSCAGRIMQLGRLAGSPEAASRLSRIAADLLEHEVHLRSQLATATDGDSRSGDGEAER